MTVQEIEKLDALSRTAKMDPAVALAIGRPEQLTPEEERELEDLRTRYEEGIGKILATAA